MAASGSKAVTANLAMLLGVLLLIMQLYMSSVKAVDFLAYSDKWCKGTFRECKEMKQGHCCDIPGGAPSVEIRDLLVKDLGYVYTGGGCSTKANVYPEGPLPTVCYSDLIITGVSWAMRDSIAADGNEIRLNGTVVAAEPE